MGPVLWLSSFLGSNLILQKLFEEGERKTVTDEAYVYAHKRGKPVLDFGCGTHPRGDYNVDIVPRAAKNFIQIQSFEKPKLPFPNKFFASALCLHVLEHVDDPENTLKELRRVSERIFIVTPKPIFWFTWLHPGHKRVFFTEEVYIENPLFHTFEDLNDIPILFPE